MYRRVEAQIVFTGTTKRELAETIGIGYNTLLSKLRGESDFTLKEGGAIKVALKFNGTIEELFDTFADTA